MSMIYWRVARIENALAKHGLLEPFPVPFFRVVLGPAKGYFVDCSSKGQIESNEMDGPIFAENDANRLVELLRSKDGYPDCEKLQAGKINEEYHVSTFDEVWHEKASCW